MSTWRHPDPDAPLGRMPQGELPAWLTTMAATGVVAPAAGTDTLEAHDRSLGGDR